MTVHKPTQDPTESRALSTETRPRLDRARGRRPAAASATPRAARSTSVLPARAVEVRP